MAATDAISVSRWLRRELEAGPPRARSLIVTLWGDALAPHGGELWLASLFELLAPFGLNERLVRTSVFRLSQDGWVVARASGRRSRYRLTTEGARRFAAAYRRVYTPPSRSWDGRWDVVIAPAEVVPAARRARLRDDLAWAGFAAFAPGVFARPTPGADPAPALLEGLAGAIRLRARDLPGHGSRRSGPGSPPPDGTSALGRPGGAQAGTLAGRVGEAWRVSEVAVEYRRFLTRFGPVAANFGEQPRASPAQAFLVRTLLVHEYRRVRLRDPQLPPALLPAGWPGAAAYALCRRFYHGTAALAEAHLAGVLAANGDRLPPADVSFARRFPADREPLAGPVVATDGSRSRRAAESGAPR